jgi:hypothetical protein
VILLVRALDLSSFSMSSFHFSPPFKDFLQKGMNVPKEDVLYNLMDMSSMSMLKIRKPF